MFEKPWKVSTFEIDYLKVEFLEASELALEDLELLKRDILVPEDLSTAFTLISSTD
jgi:hypothetical protein